MDETDDLCQINDLSGDIILTLIENRYKEDKIYTNLGDTLIAVNPCRDLDIYEKEDHEQYHWEHFDTRLQPHIFNLANRAFRRMCQTGGNQTILVCGESGAGKTENAKYVVKHLMHTCVCAGGLGDLKSNILKLDVLLESFGNARTKINSNASRFAKLLQISFRDEKVIGANVRHFLLDRNRVVDRTENCKEGNFHIFHAFFEGLYDEEKKDFCLKREEYDTILHGRSANLHDKERYLKQYHDIEEALDKSEFTFLKKMLAAILLLSDITFVKPVRWMDEIKVKNEEKLKHVAELMSVKYEDLMKGFLLKTFISGDQILYNSIQEAKIRRDTLAKHTYERLFGWIVWKINKDLHGCNIGREDVTTIGILDIPGFENLGINRFEQMCINLLNEKLQGYIFDKVFEHEKDIHGDEDMDPDLLDIKLKNDTVVDVFENKMIGIWQILSTESSPPYGRDMHLVTRLEWNLRDYTPQLIEFRKGRSTEFCIKHCAGEIWYNCENILDKNRDKLTDDLRDVMKNSKHQHINFLFSADFSGTFSRYNNGQRRKPKTDLISYRDSVNELLKELESSTPHFVRCIKPREEQSTSLFDKDVVGKQLRYNGILQLAKFRYHELSVRIPKKNSKKRYQIIPPELHAESQREDWESACERILPSEIKACFQTGQTKVFMNEGVEIYNEKELKKKKRPKEEVKTEEDQFRRLRRGGQSKTRSRQEDEVISTRSDLENDVNDQTNVKQYQSNDKENNETESPIPNNNVRLKTKSWDRFQVLDREKKQKDVHSHTSFRIIKVLVYFCLFAILLTSLVIQKITLVIATSKLKSGTEVTQNSTGNTTVNEEISESGVHSLLLVFVICTPYVLNFLASCWKVLFGNMERPSFASVLMCVIIEAFHSIGLSILVFELMPELGAVQRICVLSAIAIIPSVLKPFTVREQRPVRKQITCGKIAIIIFDVFATIIQISVIPILLIPKTDFLPEKDQIEMNKDKEGIPGIFEGLSYHSSMYIKIFAVFIFTSLSWWENFVADKGCISKILQGRINKIKGELHGSRPYFGIIVSITKIAMTTLSARLLVGERLGLLNLEFWSSVAKYNDVELFSDIIVLIVSAFLGYYAAYTACKLKMQIFSFSIPCLISTPIFVTLMVYHCNDSDSFLSVISSINLDIACDHNHGLEDNWLHITVITAWLISLYWVSQHIWFPSQERLAKMKRLFVNPLYCGILIEQHLVMNRRRRFEEISKTEKTKPNDVEDCVTRSNENNDQDGNERETERVEEENIHPRVFACATLWHETLNEMKQLLKSLYRIDKDQSERKDNNEDYYEFEAHILFDDVFQNDNLNGFVKNYASALNETASAVHEEVTKLEEPIIIRTVYGAQVIYRMPGKNLMYIHLKDKTKIRNKKRWSQVMYMYYLLGYRLNMEVNAKMNLQPWIQAKTYDQLMTPRANNTFLLALDGDVDFSPGSLRILVDRMRKDDRVGATCGRIHPIGSGPIVWYQKFEYAVAHWLQKATEHVLGCVLCSPGCFSLFRGSALMDNNVMNKYTQLPTEASHHLMYDQGEDRWLCTLLLQQGYRVDYAAGADAFTYAPEGFDEYFKQRKRWGPSTLANIMSLLQDCRNTVQANDNISWLYIVYQGSLLVATIIGPATIIMMIAGAFVAVFGVDLMISYIASLAPVILYFIICVTCKSNIQLLVAQILSGIYVIIMIVVLVGVIITAVTESPFHPSVVFLCGIIAIFIIAALFHPREWDNLLFGLLYFVLVPCGFLVLIIYSLCNLNDVSWGTRESGNAKGKAKEKKDIYSKVLSPFRKLKGNESKRFLSEDEIKELVEKMIEENNHSKDFKTSEDRGVCTEIKRNTLGTSRHQSVESYRVAESTIELEPEWIRKGIYKVKCTEMTKEEDEFWKELIAKYLKPPERDDKVKENEDREKLRELRNNVCAGMAVLNLIWISINFMFQLRRPTVVTLAHLKDGDKIEIDVLGLLFIIFFTLILVLQFCGMVLHRWGTFLHLVAITEIPNPFTKKVKRQEQQDQPSPKKRKTEENLETQIKNISRKGRLHINKVQRLYANITNYERTDEKEADGLRQRKQNNQ